MVASLTSFPVFWRAPAVNKRRSSAKITVAGLQSEVSKFLILRYSPLIPV